MNAADVTAESVREYQRGEIRQFVERSAESLAHGAVLDFGCGNQPYKDIVRGSYVGYNRAAFPGTPFRTDLGPEYPLSTGWQAILCTQMLQYVPDVPDLLDAFYLALVPSGELVLTFATNWPEIEPEDLHRFTRSGMERLLKHAGFSVLVSEPIGVIEASDFVLPLGGGIVASCV